MERIYKPHLYEGLAGDTNVNDTTTDVNDTTTDVNDTTTDVNDTTTDVNDITTDVNDTTTDDNQQQPSEESSDLPETEPVPEEKDTSKKSIQEQILNTTNFNIVMLFLFLYIVAYTILGVFYKHNGSITMSFVIDIMFTVIVAGIVYVLYYSLDSNQQQELLNDKWEDTKNYVNDEYSIAYQVIFIILFYAFIYLFRIPMSSGSKPAVIFVIETLSWLLLLFILTNQFFKISFGVSLVDDFGKYFEKDLKTTPATDDIVEVPKEEVFNISGNKYTYNDAQAICKAYGAELATYDQMENAYNNGAEWCNYGWSANQMAFFPTQKQTWQKMQVSDKYKNACGRPGVNGGYMRNPNTRYGVNCYGVKPKPTDSDLARIQNSEPSAPIQNELKAEFEEKFNISDLVLSGFNYNAWNK
jgi:hypothetical protein